jgi:hypothetical protein
MRMCCSVLQFQFRASVTFMERSAGNGTLTGLTLPCELLSCSDTVARWVPHCSFCSICKLLGWVTVLNVRCCVHTLSVPWFAPLVTALLQVLVSAVEVAGLRV